MIRDYLNGDIDKIKANEFSRAGEYKQALENYRIQKLTLEDNGVMAIIGMYNYWGDNWDGFFLMSKDIKTKHVKSLKKVTKDLILIKNMKRLETCSEDCTTINRWMKFLGFECEGTRKKYMHDKDFKLWSILWA